jgi:hypothetical protein
MDRLIEQPTVVVMLAWYRILNGTTNPDALYLPRPFTRNR